MTILKQMATFMTPKSIALIGVSRSSKQALFNPLGNLLSYGYKGDIYPVNPSGGHIQGLKAYSSIESLPDHIDLAVILTPRDTVPDMVEKCIDKGLKSIVVIAQGFADSDDKGKQMQACIVDMARKSGTRIIGPNTFGVSNAFYNMSTALPRFNLVKSPIGIISQTGIAFLGSSRFDYGKVIDIGCTCDIDAADSLEYFEHDPETEVVVIHVEGIQAGKRFIKVASRTARKKPVVILKVGRSQAGHLAAQSHTGSLTGKDEIYDSAFLQSGVFRVDDMDDMEDLALGFSRLPLMKGDRVAVVSWSGSTGISAVDAIEEYGLTVASPAEETIDAVKSIGSPSWLPVGNPVDLWACVGLGGFDLSRFCHAFELILSALLKDQGVDGVSVIIPDFLKLFDSDHWDISKVMPSISKAYPDKPVVFSMIGPRGKLTDKLDQNKKTVAYPGCKRAIRVLGTLRDRHQQVKTAVQ